MLQDADIEVINEQFSKFVRPVREEPQFKDAVVKNDDVLNCFSESWAPTQGLFSILQVFCGGLGSAFPTLQLWSPTSPLSDARRMTVELT
jgi:hypothetical protein